MRIHHLALRTHDLARLLAFYTDVLGVPVVSRPSPGNPRAPGPDVAERPRSEEERAPRHAAAAGPTPGNVWLDAGTAVIMLERAEPGEPGIPVGTRELVAFAVDDRDAWRLRLEAAGVRIEAETAYTLYFRDPDGRRVAVSSYPFCA
ncbi:MAG: VOC family protein [Myxococcales bacterium]|nr:VOC family protein [Myxococcales bacterium]